MVHSFNMVLSATPVHSRYMALSMLLIHSWSVVLSGFADSLCRDVTLDIRGSLLRFGTLPQSWFTRALGYSH